MGFTELRIVDDHRRSIFETPRRFKRPHGDDDANHRQCITVRHSIDYTALLSVYNTRLREKSSASVISTPGFERCT